MEVICCIEASVDFGYTTRRYIRENNTLKLGMLKNGDVSGVIGHLTQPNPVLIGSSHDGHCCLVVRVLGYRRPGFDSRHYQRKKVVGLERGPLSLVSTTDELLDRKVAAPV
jgi:hypothetical protein